MASYYETACRKLEELRGRDDVTVLAIESSCDETASAIVRGRQILSGVISTQISIHRLYGGVVPEIAGRRHVLAVSGVVSHALEQAKLTMDDIDAVAVTYGAGLIGALLVGVTTAKGLAFAHSKPLIAVNHIQGHIAANYLAHPDLTPPYIGLVVSGGHTAVINVKSYTDIEILGQTLDDACGEAFDKVAKVLGLPYPGGPSIEKAAKGGKNNIPMPRPLNKKNCLDFSYSGLKTAVINAVRNAERAGAPLPPEDVACSFQTAAIDMLVENAYAATKMAGVKRIAISGGVAANEYLREQLARLSEKHGVEVLCPPKYLCADNAAMIGCCACHLIKSGIAAAPLDLDACANLKMTDRYEPDGGNK